MMKTMATARRVKLTEAREHFANGGEILVSENGHLETVYVSGMTTTHSLETTTWDQLLELVTMWRNRYPNQRFFIVDRVA